MKTIELSDEMYEKLISLGKEMTEQDPRCTKMPHLFQVQETVEVATYDGQGEEIIIDEEGCTLSDNYIKERIISHKEWEKEESKKKYEELEEYEIEDLMEELEFRKINVTTEYKYTNAFFTAKACKEHIRKNHYNYREPIDYLNHSWRNPEMELVSEFLCNLVGKTNHK